MMNQQILNRAVNMATRAAMRGNPVESITWIPPQTATSLSGGSFIIQYASPILPSHTPPWEL